MLPIDANLLITKDFPFCGHARFAGTSVLAEALIEICTPYPGVNNKRNINRRPDFGPVDVRQPRLPPALYSRGPEGPARVWTPRRQRRSDFPPHAGVADAAHRRRPASRARNRAVPTFAATSGADVARNGECPRTRAAPDYAAHQARAVSDGDADGNGRGAESQLNKARRRTAFAIAPTLFIGEVSRSLIDVVLDDPHAPAVLAPPFKPQVDTDGAERRGKARQRSAKLARRRRPGS